MNSNDESRIASLADEISQGNLVNFTEFFNLTKKAVFYTAFSILGNESDSEDIVQETFIKFIDSHSRIKKEQSPFGFLLVIARNSALSLLKKRKREISFPENFDESSVPDFNDYTKAGDETFFNWMRSCLKPIEYQIVILHVINDLPHREIAKIVKRPLGSVTWIYQQAIKKLDKERKKYEKV
ncbi:MAG: RNA polymerase sigma factor [Bacilli bacterium]|jgi:RNA polymerase sigma-70 factor (ECF subfamily)|nr:RNA polymerase sigma factor [Bacilli bacterium]